MKEYYAASVFEAVLTFVVYRLSDSVAPDLIRRIWYTFSVLTHSLSRTQTSHRRLSPPAEVDVGDGGHAVRLEEPLHAAERQLCWEIDTFHKFIHSQELYQRFRENLRVILNWKMPNSNYKCQSIYYSFPYWAGKELNGFVEKGKM